MTVRCHNSFHISYILKCIFCGVRVQNFVWNFKGYLWNFTQNYDPIHRKICVLLAFIFVRFTISLSCDVISLSKTISGTRIESPCINNARAELSLRKNEYVYKFHIIPPNKRGGVFRLTAKEDKNIAKDYCGYHDQGWDQFHFCNSIPIPNPFVSIPIPMPMNQLTISFNSIPIPKISIPIPEISNSVMTCWYLPQNWLWLSLQDTCK